MRKTSQLQPAGGKFTGEYETRAFARKRAKGRRHNEMAKASRRKNR